MNNNRDDSVFGITQNDNSPGILEEKTEDDGTFRAKSNASIGFIPYKKKSQPSSENTSTFALTVKNRQSKIEKPTQPLLNKTDKRVSVKQQNRHTSLFQNHPLNETISMEVGSIALSLKN